MLKVGMVGADGRKWTEKQEKRVRNIIELILTNAEKGFILVPKGENLWDNKPIYPSLQEKPIDLTVVSGGCPVGKKMPYCCTCDKWLTLNDWTQVDAHERAGHEVIEAYDNGGVDTILEIVATQLGLKKEIYPANCTSISHKTENRYNTYEECREKSKEYSWTHFWESHFKPRNIQIARAIPLPPKGVLYDIERKGSCRWCKGEGKSPHVNPELERHGITVRPPCSKCEGTGAYSGGYFTFKEARKLRKEVYQIVIN